MNDIIVAILSEKAFYSIFENADEMEYLNYLARIQQEIEAYKTNHTNYVEYTLYKEDVDKLAKEYNIKNTDFASNLDLLTNFEVEEYRKGKSVIPKVPDYLLKTNATFVLPLRISSNQINEVPLFKKMTIQDKTVKKIKKVLNQYCFTSREYKDIKSHICEGQRVFVAPDLLNFNTYEDNWYDVKFETHIFKNNKLSYVLNPHDELFVNELQTSFFVVKNLTITFQGSLYEYRNFIFNNHAVLMNIAHVITMDFKEQYGNKFDVKPAIDRFVIPRYLQESYIKLLQHYLHMNLLNDIQNENYTLPDDILDLTTDDIKMKDNYILISNFANPQSSKQTESKGSSSEKIQKNKSQKSKKSQIDIERLRKIHEKKFPNIPFMYDDEE